MGLSNTAPMPYGDASHANSISLAGSKCTNYQFRLVNECFCHLSQGMQ